MTKRQIIGFALVGGSVFAAFYLGKRTVDPISVVNKSTDLWLRISPTLFESIKNDGNTLLFEGTPAGHLLLQSTTI